MTDTSLMLDPATTALVLIDLQRGIVATGDQAKARELRLAEALQ